MINHFSTMDSATLNPQKLGVGDNLRNPWMNRIIGQALIDLMQASCGIMANPAPTERLLVIYFMCRNSIFIRFAS